MFSSLFLPLLCTLPIFYLAGHHLAKSIAIDAGFLETSRDRSELVAGLYLVSRSRQTRRSEARLCMSIPGCLTLLSDVDSILRVHCRAALAINNK